LYIKQPLATGIGDWASYLLLQQEEMSVRLNFLFV
jgi:hypothetical protein